MLYKRFFILLLLTLSLPTFATHAAAKNYDLAFVTIDIPDSCNFTTRDGAVFVVNETDHFFTLNVVERNKDISLEEYAKNLSKSISGQPVGKVGEDGWGFFVKIAMVPFNVLVMENDSHVMELFTDQNRADWPEDIKTAFTSLQSKRPELAPLLHKLLTTQQQAKPLD
ncbi:MAG: hypothetical protein PHI96_04740 [Desulfovibrio sp.]|nr:hypothetical protein [Desulfovibrio sp.]